MKVLIITVVLSVVCLFADQAEGAPKPVQSDSQCAGDYLSCLETENKQNPTMTGNVSQRCKAKINGRPECKTERGIFDGYAELSSLSSKGDFSGSFPGKDGAGTSPTYNHPMTGQNGHGEEPMMPGQNGHGINQGGGYPGYNGGGIDPKYKHLMTGQNGEGIDPKYNHPMTGQNGHGEEPMMPLNQGGGYPGYNGGGINPNQGGRIGTFPGEGGPITGANGHGMRPAY